MGALSKVLVLLGAAAVLAALFVGFLPLANVNCGSPFLPIDSSTYDVQTEDYVFTIDRNFCYGLYRLPRIIAAILFIGAALLFIAAYMFRTVGTKGVPPRANYLQPPPPGHNPQQAPGPGDWVPPPYGQQHPRGPWPGHSDPSGRQ